MAGQRDNRKHPRVELILKVEYPSREDFLADYTGNASESGLFIATNKPFERDEELTFDISFPGLLDPIRCKAVVQWQRGEANSDDSQPAGIGVAFAFDSEEQARHIRRLVGQLNEAAERAAASPDGGRDSEPDEKKTAAFRVIVVEDNHLVREMLRFAVKKFHKTELGGKRGLEVLEAENGQVAWEQMRVSHFDMAIIDFFMPVMNGQQLINHIRSDESLKGMPVIVVSVGGDEVRKTVYAEGADLFLDKPVVFHQLFESMQKLLNLPSPAKER